MGKQSSRIYFGGMDHKEIYFQGRYHDKMYIGNELVWEKLGGGEGLEGLSFIGRGWCHFDNKCIYVGGMADSALIREDYPKRGFPVVVSRDLDNDTIEVCTTLEQVKGYLTDIIFNGEYLIACGVKKIIGITQYKQVFIGISYDATQWKWHNVDAYGIDPRIAIVNGVYFVGSLMDFWDEEALGSVYSSNPLKNDWVRHRNLCATGIVYFNGFYYSIDSYFRSTLYTNENLRFAVFDKEMNFLKYEVAVTNSYGYAFGLIVLNDRMILLMNGSNTRFKSIQKYPNGSLGDMNIAFRNTSDSTVFRYDYGCPRLKVEKYEGVEYGVFNWSVSLERGRYGAKTYDGFVGSSGGITVSDANAAVLDTDMEHITGLNGWSKTPDALTVKSEDGIFVTSGIGRLKGTDLK